jgi:hypothetical protein
MNATSAMRRVALLFGFVGCAVGAGADLGLVADIADIWKAGTQPSTPDFALLTVWPVIGFLVSWAVVRALTWAVNARKGMRMIALVLGFVGCAVGVLAERTSAWQIWDRVVAHRRYVRLMALPFMVDLVPRLSPHSVNTLPNLMPGRIKTVRVFKPGETSIELITGKVESGYCCGPPSAVDVAGLAFWPVIGFLLPWCAVRAVTWVVNWVRQGFTAT